MMADDVKFVNMTPTANDMQFEKWLNYLINIISSLYGIDPTEIGFPNRGGATGSKGGNTLNEADPAKKHQASQNKGLQPLLRFIEDLINRHIISEYSDKYVFQFVGGDTTTEMEKIKILKEKAELGMTVNEARKELGLTGKVQGGDIPINGVVVQRIGQLLQEEQYEDSQKKERFEMMQQLLQGDAQEENKQDTTNEDVGITPQDKQQGFDGTGRNVNGKPKSSTGKDGQQKDQENTNSQGVKDSYKEKPEDFKK